LIVAVATNLCQAFIGDKDQCMESEATEAMGTITKALELLGFFSRRRPEIGLSEMVRLAGRDKATVHRHLVELEENGFLEQNRATRAYTLGPAILRLTAIREATHPIRTVFRPIVEQLARETGELCYISLLQGNVLLSVFYSDLLEHGTQIIFDKGKTLPLHATSSGIAVLAFSTKKFVDAALAQPLPAYTDRTHTEVAQILTVMDATRREGLCRLDQAFDSEVCSIGGPIFGPDAHPIGSIAVAVPSVRSTPEKMADLRAALGIAVRQATMSIGGVLPRDYPAQGAAPRSINNIHS
jgi:IclR family transcriptional regulator, acetate operon repressor